MSTTVTSVPNPGPNTIITAVATCPAGKVLLGGGALVTTSDPGERPNAELIESYPSAAGVAGTWTGAAIRDSSLGGGVTMSITAWAVCTL